MAGSFLIFSYLSIYCTVRQKSSYILDLMLNFPLAHLLLLLLFIIFQFSLTAGFDAAAAAAAGGGEGGIEGEREGRNFIHSVFSSIRPDIND